MAVGESRDVRERVRNDVIKMNPVPCTTSTFCCSRKFMDELHFMVTGWHEGVEAREEQVERAAPLEHH